MLRRYDYMSFYIPFIVLLLIFLVYNVLLGMHLSGFHGDYYIQHISFYNYIRESFYESHILFPQMNMTHGGISSYANLVYYGSMNPFIWISFLLPFITMQTYVELLSVFVLASISFLNFKFLAYHDIDKRVNLITSIAFSMAPVFIVQLQTQLPFVLFYPFLLLSLIAIQNFKDRYVLFIVAMSMVYYINFTFAISIFIFMIIYIFYLDLVGKNKFKSIFKVIMFFILANIIAFMIGFLPFILQGLASNARSINADESLIFNKQFIQNIFVKQYLNFGYSWTLYLYAVVAFFAVFFKRTRKLSIFLLFLILSMLIVPLNKMLNMFLYYDLKIYINFIPFIMLLFASVIEEIIELKKTKKFMFIVAINLIIVIMYLIFPQTVIITEQYVFKLILFLILQNIAITTLVFGNKTLSMVLSVILIIFCSFVGYSNFHVEDRPVSSNCEDSVNALYRSPSVDGFNIGTCNQEFMFTEYSSIMNEDLTNYGLYNLNNAGVSFSIGNGITSDNLSSYVLSIGEEYEVQPFIKGVQSDYIYSNNINGFTNIDMVTHVENDNYDEAYQESIETLSYDVSDYTNVENVNIELSEYCTGKEYVEVEFSIIGSNKFSVNNVMYANEQDSYTVLYDCQTVDSVEIESEELIDVTNVTFRFYNYDQIIQQQYPITEPTNINIEYNESITFDLNMEAAGMMVTTIPYDDGFNVKVDGVEVDTEVVNHYFLGVPLDAGNHTIEITFTMKGFYVGLFVTSSGIVITIYLFIRKKNY